MSKAKRKISAWHLTLNTNIVIQDNDDPQIEEFRSFILEYFHVNNIQNWCEIEDISSVEEYDLSHGIEFSTSKKNMLHAHLVIILKHRTKTKLDMKKIKSDITQKYPKLYSNYRLLRSLILANHEKNNLLDYIKKEDNNGSH